MTPLRWEVDGRAWPQHDASEFVTAAGLVWRVVRAGDGPCLLLLHGTGSSAHSWSGLVTGLSRHFAVIAPDLPGHGFTRGRVAGGPSLPNIARSLVALLETVGCNPAMIVGHSAGAAIALQHAIATKWDRPIIGFNPALMPFPGLAAKLFPALAKVLFVNPFAPRIFARMAQVPGETERFLARATGSRVDAATLRCYRTLLGNSMHCDGTLAMMANWDLDALAGKLPSVQNPVLLVHSRGDSAVPLEAVKRGAGKLPHAEVIVEDRFGHLAHEEDPAMATGHILAFARAHGALHRLEAAQ